MKLHPFSIAILAVFVAGAVSGCNEAGPNGVAPQVSAVQLPGDAAADAVVADAGQEDAARAGQEQAAEPVEPAATEGGNVERALVPRDIKTCEPTVQHPVINEIMIDPVAVGDAAGEWVEIYNPTSTPVDLIDWYIAEDGPGIHKIVSSVVVPPGGYAVLCRNGDPLQNGGVTCAYTLSNFVLQNGGDTLLLLDPSLAEIDRVAFGPAEGFATSAPAGASIVLKHPFLDNSQIVFPENPSDPAEWDASNWTVSSAAFGGGDKGTPGAKNDGYEEQEHPACYDANVCTWDSCDAGVCVNVPKPGCCTSNSMCNDGDVCTQDVCNLQTLTCTNDEIEFCCETVADCADDNPCNIEYCVQNRCRFSAYIVNPGCCYAPESGNPVTGLPWSSPDERVAFANAQCDDKKFCTPDFCNMGTNLCDVGPAVDGCCNLHSECDDGNECTYDLCWNHQCTNEILNYGCCNTAEDCDDGDPCTTDTCHLGSCRHPWNSTACCTDHAFCRANNDDGNVCTDERCMLDPVTDRYTCQHVYLASCKLGLPYVETFDGQDSFQTIGWTIANQQTDATAHWRLQTTEGSLGPDTHVAFTWDPLPTIVVKTIAITPTLDGVTAGKDGFNSKLLKTTLQFRMAYKHSAPGQIIKLKVVASDSSDLFNGLVVWEESVATDLEYRLVSVELPDAVKFSPTLKIGFMVDTTPGSTYMMDSWRIDDVKVGPGRANKFVKAKFYKCPQDGRACSPQNGQLMFQSNVPGEMPPATVDACAWTRIYMCYYDEDAYSQTWSFHGYPVSYLDGAPLDQAPFVTGAQDVGAYGFCDTLPIAVQSVCNTPGNINGYYYCGIDIKPNCNEDYAGAYRAGLVSMDEYDRTGVAELHSPFESLTKFDLTVLLEDGYIIWSPNGVADPSAVAIKDAIKAAGRRAQIIKDLSMVSDLTKYDGVFAVLGVKGRYTALSPMNAARLRLFLDQGGKVYLEGGDFFYNAAGSQAPTVLHPYFKAQATSDGGVMRMAGPIEGKNFLHGATFGLLDLATVNSWIDKLVHTPEGGGREIFRNANPADPFAVAVSYEQEVAPDVKYRTIASSLPFGALVESGTTKAQLMALYLNFLENGYPPCTTVENCEDFEVCTTDYCSASVCANLPITGCVPCKDDRYRPDGSPSCGINQACDVSVGYCVDIPGFRWDAECDTDFGAAPVSATCTINVDANGVMDSSNFKVAMTHEYRGDVRLTVTSPAGTTARLRSESMIDSKRTVYETYDIGVVPSEPVTIFDGEPSAGTWTVVAQDMDPTLANGNLEGWNLFGELSDVACTDSADCPQSLCQVATCTDSICVFTPRNCDDERSCTIDSCNPATGECEYEVIQACGGPCMTHDDCFRNEVCLVSGSEDRVCDPASDIDPVSGEALCVCRAIEGQPYEYDWQTDLPAAIPDDEGVTPLIKVLNVNASGYVNKLKVKVKTTHEAAGDLRVELCHEGVCVRLRDARGGTNPGFHDVYEWDPVSGPGAIDNFRRLPVRGEWTLKVWDRVPERVGSLVYFNIYVVAAQCFNNAACDDNNLCTIDACLHPNEGGTCAHQAKQCEPSDNPCMANVCEPTTGVCGPKTAADGAPCDDGLFCTEDDFCRAGACTAGDAKVCTHLDGNCTVGECSEDLDQCIVVPAADGASCNDGEPCNAGDFCEAGACQPGPTLVCGCPSGQNSACLDDGNKCNGVDWICNADKMCELADDPVECPELGIPCRSNVCDPFDGACKMRSALNYVPCEDGLYCSVADYCLSGECTAGGARDCTSLDQDCKTGYCDEDANNCLPINKDDGTVCEKDGYGCSNDACLDGTCQFKQVVDCSDTGDECNEGICQNMGWGGYVCAKGAFPDGTPCGDEPNPCTEDTCQLGICEHDLLMNCNGPCGGEHPFDAGDDDCGIEDSCDGGIAGDMQGGCTPTCPDGMCYQAASGNIDLTINERAGVGGCISSSVPVSTGFAFVSNAELKLKLQHEALGDLQINLIDPQGARHRIWHNLGESNDGFANTFDLSFPVPYPGIETSGQPMCALKGEQIDGIWTLQVCDTAEGNSGVLQKWSLYLKGSDDVNLNKGHRCDDAIDLGNQDVNPAIFVDGTLECALDTVNDSGCGGVTGPDRMYKFNLTTKKRVTIKLLPVPGHRLILFMKGAENGTCAAGSMRCGETTDDQPSTIDMQLDPGEYFLGVDSNDGMFGYTPFRFELRVKTLLDNGADCVDDVLGEQDLDCGSLHCQNGFCCDEGDCCPSEAWEFGGDGFDPNELKLDPDWIVTDAVCPAQYKEDAICNDPDMTDPQNPINFCQGQRWDARCVNNQCVKTEVADDTACDDTVESDRCGYYHSENCGDDGPLPPAVQTKPDCLTYCTSDTDCDANAHCDPLVATDPDPAPELRQMYCVADLPNGAASNEDSDCASGHSQNGYCCRAGDCCPTDDQFGAMECPAQYTTPASCDTVRDPLTDEMVCEGHRRDPVCVDNICGDEQVRDDCRCGGAIADNCGAFLPARCPLSPTTDCPGAEWGVEWVSGGTVCLTSCLTNGVPDDSLCDDDARCDWDEDDPTNAICIPLVPNGGPCLEDLECLNQQWLPGGIGHCQNGFCCDFGDCCSRRNDCPTETPRGDYWGAPVCSDFTTCQGQEKLATCNDFRCGSEYLPEDTACVFDIGQPSDDCGFYKPVFCNGQVDQIDPPCPTTCLEAGTGVELDSMCDDNAHCDPVGPTYTNAICMADLANDQPCDEDSDCTSTFCQAGYCCDIGGCCAGCKVTNATPSFGNAGYEGPFSTESGYVQFAPTVPLAERPATGGRTVGMELGTFESVTVVTGCWDRIQGQSETDVDCGGRVCPKCTAGKKCIYNRDCLSNNCNAGTCL